MLGIAVLSPLAFILVLTTLVADGPRKELVNAFDTRAEREGDVSVELDALAPPKLRASVIARSSNISTVARWKSSRRSSKKQHLVRGNL